MSIDPSVLQLIVILIAPAAALLGAWLSPYIVRRTEQRAWLRDRQADAYLEAIHASELFRLNDAIEAGIKGALQQYSSSTTKQDENPTSGQARSDVMRAKVRSDFNDRYSPLVRAASQVSLFGDENTNEAMLRVVSALIALGTTTDLSEDRRRILGAEAYEAGHQLVNSSRKILRLNPLPKSE
jgi:hypothetical protein